MAVLTIMLWGLPALAAFLLLLLLIKSQDRFASVAKSGWTRMISGAVLLVLFSVSLLLLHLPVVHMLLGPKEEFFALAAYLLFAVGLLLMVPATVGWMSEISQESARTEKRISSVSLTEDLLSVTEQPYVLTELLTAGLGTLTTHVGVPAGMVWLLAPDRVSLVLAGSRGFDKPALKAAEQVVASGHELLDRALQGKGVVTAGDLSARSRFVANFPGMEAFGSVAVVPLSGGGELIGMALLASMEPYHFGPDLVRTLEGAGRILGHAVANQRLERLLRKSERRERESSRALLQWERITGDGMPASTQAMLHGLAEATGSQAAYLVLRGSRYVDFGTSPTLVGLPMEGIWSEALTTSDQKKRALWVSPGTRTQDPRGGVGRWIVLPTPAGHLFYAPRAKDVEYSQDDLARFAKGAEMALLLAPGPDLPEPERLVEAGRMLAVDHPTAAGVAERVAEVISQAEAVLVWQRSEGRLRVAGAHGCDEAPLASVQLPVGQGSVGKAALAGVALRVEAQAELGRSWLEYSEADRQAFTTAFGGFERPAAEYVVPIPQTDLILHLLRFTRGGWSEHSVQLTQSLVSALEPAAAVRQAPHESIPIAGINDLNNVFTGILGQGQLLEREWAELNVTASQRNRLSQMLEAAQAGAELVKKLTPDVHSIGGAGLDSLAHDLLSGRHITDDLYLLPDNSAVQVHQEFEPTPQFGGDRQKLQDLVWNVLLWAARDKHRVKLGISADERYSYLAAGTAETSEPLKGPYGDFFKAPDVSWSRLLPARDLDFLRSSGAQIAANADDPRRVVVRFPHRLGDRAGVPAGAGLNVLAIDDQEIIRDLLLNMFMGMGHRIRVCRSGEEGLEALESARFDLVLTDLGMPGMSGWEVAAAVKRRNPNTPVVLITGWGFNFAEEQVRKAGVDYVLTKPFRLEHLTEVVEAAVRRSPQVH